MSEYATRPPGSAAKWNSSSTSGREARAISDSVDLGEVGGQDPVLQGEFDGFLGPRWPVGQRQCGKRDP